MPRSGLLWCTRVLRRFITPFAGKPRRVTALALVFLLVFTGTFQQALDDYARDLANKFAREQSAAAAPVINQKPEQEPLNQVSPPSPSGAYAPYPLNHTLDGETVYLGGEVANHDFEDAAYTVGTPPTNHNFSAATIDQGTALTNPGFASSFTGWTAGSNTTIQTTAGPDGNWVQMGFNGSILSNAFTLDAEAQVISFDYGALSTSASNSLKVSVLSGVSYGTTTELETFTCTNCGSWQVVQASLGQWAGQSIKLKFQRLSGTVGVDRITELTLIPGYTTSGFVTKLDDSGNAFAETADIIDSSPFTVHADT